VLTVDEIRLLAVDRDNNHAPVIEAEKWLRAKTGIWLALPAAAWDDGLPMATAFVTNWRVTGGDAAQVHFDDAETAGTGVVFTRSGNYVLRLEASDGVFTEYAVIDVEVVASGTQLLIR